MDVIPRICKEYPHVNFLIAGDGPKRVDLEQMREKHLIMDRVELIGSVASHDVPSILVRGQIFLNTSLTEAFCMAIVEAACCGLLVVSTKVGGIPEVLPSDMIRLADPNEQSLYDALCDAIAHSQSGSLDPITLHEKVKSFYSWALVAERTENVYLTSVEGIEEKTNFVQRLENFNSAGLVYGKILCICAALEHLILLLLEWFMPAHSVEKAVNYKNKCKK